MLPAPQGVRQLILLPSASPRPGEGSSGWAWWRERPGPQADSPSLLKLLFTSWLWQKNLLQREGQWSCMAWACSAPPSPIPHPYPASSCLLLFQAQPLMRTKLDFNNPLSHLLRPNYRALPTSTPLFPGDPNPGEDQPSMSLPGPPVPPLASDPPTGTSSSQHEAPWF